MGGFEVCTGWMRVVVFWAMLMRRWKMGADRLAAAAESGAEGGIYEKVECGVKPLFVSRFESE